MKALIISEKTNLQDCPETAGMYLELAFYSASINKHTEANAYFLKCIEITHFTYPKNHPEVIARLMHLGNFYQNVGMLEENKTVVELCLHLTQQYYEEDEQIFIRPYSNMIVSTLKMGNLQKTVSYLEKYIRCLEKLLGKESFGFKASSEFLSRVKQQDEVFRKSKETLKKPEVVKKMIEDLVRIFLQGYMQTEYEISTKTQPKQ